MNYKFLRFMIGFALIACIIPTALAIQSNLETAGVGRIVGDIDHIIANVNQEKGEKIIIILPDGKNYQSLTGLEDTLQSKYQIKSENIIKVNSSETACNDWKRLEENTLILIGNRSNNNAIRCTPWFDVGKKQSDTFKGSITIERNVWGGDNYAIILSSDEEMSIKALNDFLVSPEFYSANFMDTAQTVYIQQFSKPPELISTGDKINGFVLGKCEYMGDTIGEQGSCMASDFTASIVPVTSILTDVRDAWIYCLKGEKNGMDNLVCTTSTGGAIFGITELTGVGTIASIPGDAFMGTAKRIIKTISTALKSTPNSDVIIKTLRISDEKSMRNFYQLTDSENLIKAAERTEQLMKSTPNKRALRQINQLDPDALKTGIQNINELESTLKGTEIITSKYKSLEEFAPEIKKCIKKSSITINNICSPEETKKLIEKIKKIGKDLPSISTKYGDEIADITLKGIRNNIIDPTKVEPEKLADYISNVKKLNAGIVDPVDEGGVDQLVKMFKSDNINSKALMNGKTSDKEITKVAVLRKGQQTADHKGFGWTHIKEQHGQDFAEKLGFSDEGVQSAIQIVIENVPEKEIDLETGRKIFEKSISGNNDKTKTIRVVVGDKGIEKGSIITAFPIN